MSINTNLKIEDLPELPQGWSWKFGELDGEPEVTRIDKRGWETTIHEAHAQGYVPEISINVRPAPGRDWPETQIGPRVRFIPLAVFAALDQALKMYYCVNE